MCRSHDPEATRRTRVGDSPLQFQCEPRRAMRASLPLHCYLSEPKTTVLDTVLKIALERWRWRNLVKSLARRRDSNS
jgi:hypothetical protein